MFFCSPFCCNIFFKEIKYYAPGQIDMKAMYPWILANGTWNQEPISFEEFDENGNLTELIHRDESGMPGMKTG